MKVLRQVGHSANGSSSTVDHQIKIHSSLTVNIIVRGMFRAQTTGNSRSQAQVKFNLFIRAVYISCSGHKAWMD